MIHAIQGSFRALRDPQSSSGGGGTKTILFGRLLRTWMYKLIPGARLLGAPRNFSAFLGNLKALLGAGKGCTLRISAILHGMNVQEVPWLAQEPDFRKRGEIFAKLIGNPLKNPDFFYPIGWNVCDFG